MRKFELTRKSKSILFKIASLSVVVLILVFGFSQLPKVIDKVVNKTTKINQYKVLYESLLGISGEKKILLLFMNNSEQRYGGGFIGSVGYVTVNKGKIKADPVKSVYYFDRYAKPDFTAPIDLNDPELGPEANTLRNSGQNISWLKNGDRAKKIFEYKTGKKVDIVIGITPEVLKLLLNNLGPVYLQDYSKEISSENIIDSLQTEVEFGKDKIAGKDPKSIMSSLANKILDRVSQKSMLDLAYLKDGLAEEVYKKQIVFYSKDREIRTALKELGFDGSIKRNEYDYFMVYEKNESIDKSNAFIDRKIDRNVMIGDDGRVNVEVNITRRQTRDKSIPYIDPKNNEFTYLIKENNSNIRIAIPKGSKMLNRPQDTSLIKIETTEFVDIYEFRSQLIPLEEASYRIAYSLPVNLVMSNNLKWESYIQIQNGGWPYKLQNTVVTPSGFVFDSSNKNVKIDANKIVYNEDVNKDVIMNFVFSKK